MLLALLPSPARASSKALIAAAGDAAPGGGVFAGPGFTDWPTAAGNGWIAFRRSEERRVGKECRL